MKTLGLKFTLMTAVVLICSGAFADTVRVSSTVDFSSPSLGKLSSSLHVPFTPNGKIVFTVAGKQCTWASSADPFGAGGGAGCNYSISVDANGNLTDATSNGKGCTASGQAMLDACQ